MTTVAAGAAEPPQAFVGCQPREHRENRAETGQPEEVNIYLWVIPEKAS